MEKDKVQTEVMRRERKSLWQDVNGEGGEEIKRKQGTETVKRCEAYFSPAQMPNWSG